MRFRENSLLEIYPDLLSSESAIWVDVHVLYPFEFIDAEAYIAMGKAKTALGKADEIITIRANLVPDKKEKMNRWFHISSNNGDSGIPLIFRKDDINKYGRISCTAAFHYYDDEDQKNCSLLHEEFCFKLIPPENEQKRDYCIERSTTIIPTVLESRDIKKRKQILNSHDEVIQGKAILKNENIFTIPIYANRIKTSNEFNEEKMTDAARRVLMGAINSGIVRGCDIVNLSIFVDNDIFALSPVSTEKSSDNFQKKNDNKKLMDFSEFFL